MRTQMFAKTPKTIKYIIYINVFMYFLMIVGRLFGYNLMNIFGLLPYLALKEHYLWQFITYMFVHGSVFHLFFNLLMLWMFGSELCRLWGYDFFLKYYFICGIGGGIAVAGLSFIDPRSFIIPTVGSSGAIFGLFLAYGIIFKNRLLYVFGIIPMRARTLVIVLGVIEFLALLSESQSGISHLAHLGGLLTGLVYLRLKEVERKLTAKKYKDWKENKHDNHTWH